MGRFFESEHTSSSSGTHLHDIRPKISHRLGHSSLVNMLKFTSEQLPAGRKDAASQFVQLSLDDSNYSKPEQRVVIQKRSSSYDC